MTAAVRFQLHHRRALDRVKSLRPANRRVAQVVIDQRNGIAWAGAIEALNQGDVALVWGADHLPGLAALLEARGFRRDREVWFEVFRL